MSTGHESLFRKFQRAALTENGCRKYNQCFQEIARGPTTRAVAAGEREVRSVLLIIFKMEMLIRKGKVLEQWPLKRKGCAGGGVTLGQQAKEVTWWGVRAGLWLGRWGTKAQMWEGSERKG